MLRYFSLLMFLILNCNNNGWSLPTIIKGAIKGLGSGQEIYYNYTNWATEENYYLPIELESDSFVLAIEIKGPIEFS
jgi:hypothetical protein